MIYFITGIDTNIGKTYVTGRLAQILSCHHSVITQKLIQTGCDTIADDIITHRAMMNIPLQTCDRLLQNNAHNQNAVGVTCRYVFKKPCSPHLASQIENIPIDPNLITQDSQILAKNYGTVLLEGAGGVLVPITPQLLTLDYISQANNQYNNYQVVLVTSGRIGSLNHTLLSLQAIKQRNLTLHSVIYNHFFDEDDEISQNSIEFLQSYLDEFTDSPLLRLDHHDFVSQVLTLFA